MIACACCHRPRAEEDDHHCQGCGEASWVEREQPAPAEPDEPTLEAEVQAAKEKADAELEAAGVEPTRPDVLAEAAKRKAIGERLAAARKAKRDAVITPSDPSPPAPEAELAAATLPPETPAPHDPGPDTEEHAPEATTAEASAPADTKDP